MDIREEFGFEELVNESERLVFAELNRRLAEFDDLSWLTEDCALDLAAYALNHTKPHYRVNLLGRIYADSMMDQYGDDIRRAVDEAIEKITPDYRS